MLYEKNPLSFEKTEEIRKLFKPFLQISSLKIFHKTLYSGTFEYPRVIFGLSFRSVKVFWDGVENRDYHTLCQLPMLRQLLAFKTVPKSHFSSCLIQFYPHASAVYGVQASDFV
ncbi:hypothetical protein GGR08_001439 [Bartonella fuyuanensis]|uniref:Uncharacterized protein n=1 Tax=Bartonella fuyuanensis TaxID=1460968 RepID=A0A840E046_9HYPH|nr:hypothetical protein [Bartonella fuyuanensis]MBB4077122.1 hypothetical protein [Bartonella fuyuanensis]